MFALFNKKKMQHSCECKIGKHHLKPRNIYEVNLMGIQEALMTVKVKGQGLLRTGVCDPLCHFLKCQTNMYFSSAHAQ